MLEPLVERANGLLTRLAADEVLVLTEPVLSELAELHRAGHYCVTQPGSSFPLRLQSPEHALGAAPDARSDLWTLAVLLFRLLTTEWPFDKPDERLLLLAIATKPHRSIAQLASALGQPFETFFGKALRKDAVDRFQSAEEFLSALRVAATAPFAPIVQPLPLPVYVEPDPKLSYQTTQEPAPVRARRVYLLASVLAVLCLGGGAWVIADQYVPAASLLENPPPEPPEPPVRLVTDGQLPRVTLPGARPVSLPLGETFVLNVWLERCADCMPKFEAWRSLAKARRLPELPVVNVSAFRPADPSWAESYFVDEHLVWDDGKGLVRPLGLNQFTTFLVRGDGLILFRGHPDQPGFLEALDKAAHVAAK